MDPDERKKLNRTLELAEENNKMLTKLHRNMQWGRIFKVIYWIIIIGLAVGAFYFIQPYVEQLGNVYEGFRSSVDRVQDVFSGQNGMNETR